MIIHDMEGEIAIGDTMRTPKFLNKSSLEKFDLVAANPMWNQKGYDAKFYDEDTYNRFPVGYPPGDSADWGWVQHMFASLNDKGRAAIVLDTGAVSRGSGSKSTDKETEIRKWFVDHDQVEGVLLLPENLFYNTSSPGIILILNKAKPKERRGNIILVNASTRFKKGRPKNFIPDGYDETGKYDAAHDVITQIADAFDEGKDVEKFVKVISKSEAVKNAYNLSPSRYVETAEANTYREIPEILGELVEVEDEAKAVDKELKSIFTKLGIKPEVRV